MNSKLKHPEHRDKPTSPNNFLSYIYSVKPYENKVLENRLKICFKHCSPNFLILHSTLEYNKIQLD